MSCKRRQVTLLNLLDRQCEKKHSTTRKKTHMDHEKKKLLHIFYIYTSQ